LAAGRVSFAVVDHEQLGEPVRSPLDVARVLGIEPDRLAKTLFVTEAPDHLHFALAVLPALSKLRFAAVADHLGWRRAVLASTEELAAHMGQPVFGVSPIGAAGIPVLLDRSLAGRPTMLVGGGTAGIEIELDPRSLVLLTAATLLDLRAR
jgi:Cys-tRNA(Pro)/Cys-tRNA(Cys) deacylase